MKIENNVVNALTVDVEDYYQVEGFSSLIAREEWEKWESRIERNTYRLLDLFARHQALGTFFILGWIAERHPKLIREIVSAGHEVACHSYNHRFIQDLSPDEFRADARQAKRLLEDVSGQEVIGYRAPTYSITKRTLWALNILIEEGFRYDSSIFPIYHDRYGIPNAERFPHFISCDAGEILEFPPSTVRLGGSNLPFVGGGYFRLMPYPLFRWGVRRINRQDRQAAIFMIHTWEIDPAQPILAGSRLSVWRHRNNLHKTEPRLSRLLTDFKFAPVRDVLRLEAGAVEFAEPRLVGSTPAFAQMD